MSLKRRSRSLENITLPSSNSSKWGKRSRSVFRDRHRVHCAIPDQDGAYQENRSLYDEHVVSVPSQPPAPSYTNTVRFRFKRRKKHPKRSRVSHTPDDSFQTRQKDASSQTESLRISRGNEGRPKEASSQTDPVNNPRRNREVEASCQTEPLEKHRKKTKGVSSQTDPQRNPQNTSVRQKDTSSQTDPGETPRRNPEGGVTVGRPKDASSQTDPPEGGPDPPGGILPLPPDPPPVDKMVSPPVAENQNPPPTSSGTENRLVLVVEKDLSNNPGTCDHKADFALVLNKLDEIQKWFADLNLGKTLDDSQVLAHLKVVHQDIVHKLSQLNPNQRDALEVPQGDCLCYWLRQMSPPNEKDEFMLTCPHCSLCHQGRHLLTAAGLSAAKFEPVWPHLGRILICLQTDDDVKLTQILTNLIHDTLSKSILTHEKDGKECLNNSILTGSSSDQDSILTVTPNAEAMTIALPNVSGIQLTTGFDSVYEMLLYFSILWNAYRCVTILLQWLKVPKSKVDAIKEIFEDEKKNPPPLPTVINNINRIFKSIHDGTASEDKIAIDCIYVAAREKNTEAFKVLMYGPRHKKFPKNTKQVDVLKENPKYGKTIFQFLISLSYDSMKKWGKEEDCFLQMIDYLYDPMFIRRWAYPEGILGEELNDPDHSSSTREALKELVGQNGEMLKYAADQGTSGNITKILENPPYRREDKDEDKSCCYLANGMDDILKHLHHRTTKEEIGPLIDVEPLRTIVEDKWTFYRPYYIAWLLASFVYMIIFTMCANWRPIGTEKLSDMYRTPVDYGRLVLEILVILGVFFLLYGIVQECRALQHHVPASMTGVRKYTSWFIHHIPKPYRRYDLYVLVNVVFVALVITIFGMRLTLNQDEDIIFSLALFFGWINMVHRVAAFKRFGMFPIIMHHCLMKDFFTGFVWVFLLMLVGLATATFTVYQTIPLTDQSPSDFPAANFWWTPFSLLKLTFGLLETEYATQTRYAWIGITLFLLYLFFMNIVLFNLLISMLGTTYTRVYDIVDQHWIQIQLSYVLLMERWWPSLRFPKNQHKKCQLWKTKSIATYRKEGESKFIYISKEQSTRQHIVDEVYIM